MSDTETAADPVPEADPRASFRAGLANVRAHVAHAINGDVRAMGAALAALVDLFDRHAEG